MEAAAQAPPAPVGKVQQTGASWRPLLVLKGTLAPLGEHSSREEAQAAYDAAKLRAALDVGKPASKLKLHRPAAAYTSHPLWQYLLPQQCSFEVACHMLAGGLAAGLLAPAAEAAGHLQAAQAAAAAHDSPAAAAAATAAPVAATTAAAAAAAAALPGPKARNRGHSTAAAPSAALPTTEAGGEPSTPQRKRKAGAPSSGAPAQPFAKRQKVARDSAPQGNPTDPGMPAAHGSKDAAEEVLQARRPAAGYTRAAHWLEYPAGSGQFAVALSNRVVSSGSVLLPARVRQAGFQLRGEKGSVRVDFPSLPASSNAEQHAAGSNHYSSRWNFWTYSRTSGRVDVSLTLPFAFRHANEVQAGDVLVVRNTGVQSTTCQLWRAGSPKARAFHAAELKASPRALVRAPSKHRMAKEAAGGEDGRERREEEAEEAVLGSDSGANSSITSSVPGASVPGSRRLQQGGSTALLGTAHWQEPGPGGCVLTLSVKHAQGTRQITMPGRHARAFFGQESGTSLPPEHVTLVTPDNRDHTCRLLCYGKDPLQDTSSYFLRNKGVADALHTLAVAAGGQLHFQPAGLGRTYVTLIQAAQAQAGSQEAQPHCQPRQRQVQDRSMKQNCELGSRVEQQEGKVEVASVEQQLPGRSSTASDSPEASAAAEATAASADATPGSHGLLPEVGVLKAEDEWRLWMALAQVFACLEGQGCASSAAIRAYRLALAGMASHRWRLVHYCILRAFAQQGQWAQAAAFMGRASRQARENGQA